MSTATVFPARPGSPKGRLVFAVVTVVLMGALLFGANALFGPASYEVRLTADELVVDARLGFVSEGRSVPRAGLQGRRVDATKGARIAGTARPGYCTGTWQHEVHRRVWQATTCGSEAVLVTGTSPPLLLEVGRPEALIGALEGGDSGTFAAPQAETDTPGWRALRVVFGLLLLSIVAVPPLLLRRLRGLDYVVEDGVLRVPGFLGSKTVRLQGAVVERVPNFRWRKTIRAAGAAMPGLHLGVFRSEGRWVHLSATSLEDVIQVEGRDRCVVVSPADPDAFVAALVAHGSQA